MLAKANFKTLCTIFHLSEGLLKLHSCHGRSGARGQQKCCSMNFQCWSWPQWSVCEGWRSRVWLIGWLKFLLKQIRCGRFATGEKYYKEMNLISRQNFLGHQKGSKEVLCFTHTNTYRHTPVKGLHRKTYLVLYSLDIWSIIFFMFINKYKH